MSDDRSDVLARVRAALSGRRERKARPVFDSELLLSRHAASDASRVASFTRQLERVHGRVLRSVEALAAFLNEQRAFEGYVDAALLPLVAPALAHPFVLHREFVRSEVDTYAFAITRATGGIAETAKRYPMMHDITADFVYMRLHGDRTLYQSGYGDRALEKWARRIRAWHRGSEPRDAQKISKRKPPTSSTC